MLGRKRIRGQRPSPRAPAPRTQSTSFKKLRMCSGDNDDDIFQGPFAIKDAGQSGADESRDRFSRLPAKVMKYVEHFEREVLETIPSEIPKH